MLWRQTPQLSLLTATGLSAGRLGLPCGCCRGFTVLVLEGGSPRLVALG